MSIKSLASVSATALLVAGTAHAGGIERGSLPVSILFENGNYAQFSVTSVNPSVSGEFSPFVGGGDTGNMAPSYMTFSGAYKHQLSDQFSLAVMVGQPYGADAAYTQNFYAGLGATWDSTNVAVIGKYDFSENMSVFGGLQAVRSNANISIPGQLTGDNEVAPGVFLPLGNYEARTSKETDIGFILGAAYEIPEIALRASLTYTSEIEHDFTSIETFSGAGGGSGAELPGTATVRLPQSVKLDFQTGINPQTLILASIKWTDWTTTSVTPQNLGSEILGYDNDTWTYTLGVGRKITDELSLVASLGYEKSNGGNAARLAPTDGNMSLSIGARYKMGNATLSGGISYAKLGDATRTDQPGVEHTFTDNKAIGVGVSLGIQF